MSQASHVILNLNPIPGGIYASGWRTGYRDPASFITVEHYVELAKIAERGHLDALFLADTASWSPVAGSRTFRPLDPTVSLPYIAAHTSHLGLIATVSTTYNTPYNLARRLLSLDHVSGGRAAWNVVVTAGDEQARNSSLPAAPPKQERYARAREFVEIVRQLWHSWEDGAIVADAESGVYIDATKVRPIHYQGDHFQVAGPLIVPPSPQHHPVIIQAGGSEGGTDLAGRYANAVYSTQPTQDGARAYREELRRRAAHHGRSPDTIKLLPGLVTIIGSTEEEAQRRARDLLERIPVSPGLARLSTFVELPPEVLATGLDEPLPWHQIPAEALNGVGHSATVLRTAKENHYTVRDILHEINSVREHATITGTPEQVANKIETWFRSGAVDGFNIMPAELPLGAEQFVDHVVPLLQQRGLFRTEYTTKTLRGHYGLSHHD